MRAGPLGLPASVWVEPQPATQAIAASRWATENVFVSPGVIQPKRFVRWCIHSMSVTSAIRFQDRRCSNPTLRSCHTAPPVMPSNSLMTMRKRTSPVAAARSSAGKTTSR